MPRKVSEKSEQLSLGSLASPDAEKVGIAKRAVKPKGKAAANDEALQLPVLGAVDLAARPAPAAATEAPAPAPAERSDVPTSGGPKRRASAESMAAKQRDISVAEFFTKNRHLLGFDNPAKALLTTVKEAVDNALDACEEAGILPDLDIGIVQINGDERFRVTVRDNGPGIVKAQIPKIFGKLLYGSKFHTLKQARGQQGIGISAAGMYGQLTTGRPMVIVSRTGRTKPAFRMAIRVDTQKNQPEILSEEQVETPWDHGTQIEIELAAQYRRGIRSVEEYLEQVAITNPHATLAFHPPAGNGEDMRFERVSSELPPEAKEIRPHPYGVELGMLLKMLQSTKSRTVRAALTQDFSRVSSKIAEEICAIAGVKPEAKATKLAPEECEALHKAMGQAKIMAPPTSCVVPIGEELLHRGLERRFRADFFTSSTRPPSVYRGNPFVVEVGLAYGGDIPSEEPCELMRFANRVPLQYQKGACAIMEAATDVAWRGYGLQQPRGSLPIAPMILVVHVASAWVPFTSESKEAIAHIPEILKELKLAMQECGRRLSHFLNARRRSIDAAKKSSYIAKYIPHIADALRELLGFSEAKKTETIECLQYVLERSRTEGMKAVEDEIAAEPGADEGSEGDDA